MSRLANSISWDVIAQLKSAAGEGGWTDDPEVMAPYLEDRRGRFTGTTPLVLRPDNTQAVAAVVARCAEARVAIIPQSGNTGLVGGSVPDQSGHQILLSLSRLTAIRRVDPIDSTLTAEAGCVLADIHTAAADVGMLFPLSLAAQGSCRIGGNLSTNAGGTAVLRYGNARELVLGLEVVLPNGEIWNGLRRLRKDNTGYDLKQLFLGSEGTLGIITAAVLRLFPGVNTSMTALVAVRDLEAALDLLARCRESSGDAVTTFEYMSGQSVQIGLAYGDNVRLPMDAGYEHYLLVEFALACDDVSRKSQLRSTFEALLADYIEKELVLDGVLAQSEQQAATLWQLREGIPAAQRGAGASIKHDVSVPVSRVPEFLERGTALAKSLIPGVRVCAFGHLGDGNIHFNLSQPPSISADAFLAEEKRVQSEVYALVAALEGSFSAEHGIGRFKRDDLRRYRSGVELRIMRALKDALDPDGILSPGKVL